MSRLPFELLLALRYLRPKRTFVSVITLISVLGVCLGVAVLIIVISVMSGFDLQLRDKILGFNSHLKIIQPGHTIANYKDVMRKVTANPLVLTAAPLVLERVLIQTEPPSTQTQAQADAPYLRGVDIELETNLTVLPHSIVSGTFDLSNRGLVIGKVFADLLNLEVGDHVMVYAPGQIQKMIESKDKDRQRISTPEYEIRGIFDVGHYEYDKEIVIASLEDAQELYDLGNTVHGLLVNLKNPYKAPEVRQQLKEVLGHDYRVITWMEENSQILNALAVEKNVMFYLLFFIMIVAALCILSALITFVVQKTREIGMLKAIGATDIQVALLFLSQGALIGALGDILGYGLGMLALAYRNEFLHFMNKVFGFSLFPPSIYQFTELPAIIIWQDIVLICGSAWLICMLGGLIPAWRAGRLKPVEALRYE